MEKRIKTIIIFLKKYKLIYKAVYYLNLIYCRALVPIIKRNNYLLFKKFHRNSIEKDIKEAYEFMGKYGVAMMPFFFTLNYIKRHEILYEYSSNYPYVLINSNKIFFPKNMSRKAINNAVNNALMEQDIESPHKYKSTQINISGHTAILIGGSDGMFALELVNLFQHIFLFECDEDWIEPLSYTLKPYKDKITIVNKFVSDSDENNKISLDTFFIDYKYPIDFMQNDVEGNALAILNGSKQILYRNNLNLAIACYHTNNEATELNEFLLALGYNCSFSNKFIFVWMQRLQEPYIRRGVLFAKKQ